MCHALYCDLVAQNPLPVFVDGWHMKTLYKEELSIPSSLPLKNQESLTEVLVKSLRACFLFKFRVKGKY